MALLIKRGLIRIRIGRSKNLAWNPLKAVFYGTEKERSGHSFAQIRFSSLSLTAARVFVLSGLEYCLTSTEYFTFRADGPDAIAIDYAADYYPYGKILREYRPCDANRYLTTHHERDKATGYDNRGARLYDSEIGRFLGVDPLASKFASFSPYNYVLGNPVRLVDPDGKEAKVCVPCVTGLIGAGIELGTQITVNMATGQSFTEAVGNVDVVDVLVAGGEAAITGGSSIARRTAIRGAVMVASEVIQSSVDVQLDGDVDIVGTEGSTKTASTVITDTGVGVIAGTAGEGTGAVIYSATQKTRKQLRRAETRLRRSMQGSRGEAQAEEVVEELFWRVVGNNTIEETSRVLVTETIKHKGDFNPDKP